MLARCLLLAVCLGMACAATWMGHTPMKPKEFADKEGCYVEEIQDVIPYGVTIEPIGFCYRISCEKRMMYYASCGVVGTDDPSCHITDVDLSKPYPQCCQNIKCDAENNII